MYLHLSTASLWLHGAVLAAASKTTKSTGSSATSILFLVVIVAAGYFLLVRPQRQRARKTQQTQQSIEIGDEVMLTSGIIGRVTWLEGDRARIQIAPNTEIEVLKAAIGRRTPPAVSDEDIAPRAEGAPMVAPESTNGVSPERDHDETVHESAFDETGGTPTHDGDDREA